MLDKYLQIINADCAGKREKSMGLNNFTKKKIRLTERKITHTVHACSACNHAAKHYGLTPLPPIGQLKNNFNLFIKKNLIWLRKHE